MKTLANLIRNQAYQPLRFRGKKSLSSEIMAKRKQNRRLKKINTYSRQYTNEQTPHNWITPKRTKALGQFYQNMANMHHMSNPIPLQIQKQMKTKFTQASDYEYYKYRNFMKEIQDQKKLRAQSNMQQALNFLPTWIRRDIKQYPIQPMINQIRGQHLYNEQYHLFLPKEMLLRMNLRLRALTKMEVDVSAIDMQ